MSTSAPGSPPVSLVIRLLGPFEAQVNGDPLPRLRSLKGQWLVALLTLHANREVERDWLAGLLWPDSSERSAFANLRCSLKDLRRALGPEEGRLRSPTPRTLWLDLSGAEVDLLAFDAAIARGNPASLRHAAELYRGPLLERCAEEWVILERQSREEAYLQALETLAAQAMAASDPETAACWLRRAVIVDPLRESAQRSLMQALAAGGNYAAALLVYRDLRQKLHREINAEPDPETQALFEQVRTNGRRRARGPGGDYPRGEQHPTSAEPRPPDRAVSPDSRGPSVTSLSASVHRDGPGWSRSTPMLPAALTRFIGRERQIGEAAALLAQNRLLTLTGSGGCGKTRLALRVADEIASTFEDGVRWVELAALADETLVPQAFAAALEVREQPGRPLTNTLIGALRSRTLLLALDNCEHLLTAVAALARDLLMACPNLRVLATSREALGVAGEQLLRVPSLALPPAVEVGAGVEAAASPALLLQSEAVQLFVDRAQLVQPAFAVTDASAAVAADICRRLDGMPLAIELAAARIRAMPVEMLRERLDDGFRLLTGGGRTQLPRHQTLEATIGWSFDLLTEPERALFWRLSVFTGGWNLEAAEAVCSDQGGQASGPVREKEVLDLLTALVDKSLVQYEDGAGAARYRLLETVRQYARDRLLEAGEGEALRERHGAFCLQLAEAAHAAARAGKSADLFERLEADHDNLRAALAWFDGRAAASVLRLAGALGEFWAERGHWNEGRQWLERALAGTPGAEPTAERARALVGAGRLAIVQRDSSAARDQLEESIALYRRLGDTRGLFEALTRRASALNLCENNAPAARELQEEAVALARALGDPRLLATALGNLSAVTVEPQTAHTLLEERRVVLEENLAHARQVGDRQLAVHSLDGLAQIFQALGEEAKAVEYLEESLSLARAANMNMHLCNVLFHRASALAQQGDPERAKPLREECLRRARELRLPLFIGRAMILVVSHDLSYEEALRMIDQDLREYGPGLVATQPLSALGHRARDQGDYDWAATCYRRSLAVRQEHGDRVLIARGLEEFAGLAARQQRWERAATLLGAAEAISGATLPLVIAAEYERAVQGARAVLGEARFAAAWADGRALSCEEAVRYALEEASRLETGGARNKMALPQAVPGGSRYGASSRPPVPHGSHNLPASLVRLIGREDTIAAVRDLLALEEVRLLTLTGPAGVGKTSLGLEIAARSMASFPHGIFFVSLAPLVDPTLVIPTIAQALGLREPGGGPLVEVLKDYLREKQLLLLLDNFEQVLPAAAPVAELLAAAPRLKLLVTSRSPLHLHGEQEFPVPPLPVPDLKHLPPAPELVRNDAVRLFVARARNASPSFELTPEDGPAVAAICCRLDGLPLAIELAAARVKLFPPQELLARLQNRLTLLTSGTRDAPARHHTLRAAIAWSYDLLSELEKRLFRRLSVFVGGCTLAAAEAVCGPETDAETDIVEGLASQIDQSLLRQQERANGETRYTMLETIREFGQERLAESSEEQNVRCRHAGLLLAMAEEAEPELIRERQQHWLERLKAEHDNIRAATAWALENEPATVLRLAAALLRFWVVHDCASEGRDALERAIERSTAVPPELRAKALKALASLTGDPRRTQALLEEALPLACALQDQSGIAFWLGQQGHLAMEHADYPKARELFDESIRTARAAEDGFGLAQAARNRAIHAWWACDYEAARRFHEESLAASRQLGDRFEMARTLSQLAWLSYWLGEYEPARRWYTESLALHREIGAKSRIANATYGLGDVALNQGDYQTSVGLIEESLELFRDLGNRAHSVLDSLGELWRRQGEYDRAQPLFEEMLEVTREKGVKKWIGLALCRLGSVAWGHGDACAARRFYEESLATLRDAPAAHRPEGVIHLPLRGLGDLALAAGDCSRARDFYRESLETQRKIRDRKDMPDGFERLARLAEVQGRAQWAAQLLGAASGLRQSMGARLPPVDQPEYERTMTALRSALGDAAFAAAWDDGRAMSLDEALSYALDAEPVAPLSGRAAPEPLDH